MISQCIYIREFNLISCNLQDDKCQNNVKEIFLWLHIENSS